MATSTRVGGGGAAGAGCLNGDNIGPVVVTSTPKIDVKGESHVSQLKAKANQKVNSATMPLASSSGRGKVDPTPIPVASSTARGTVNSTTIPLASSTVNSSVNLTTIPLASSTMTGMANSTATLLGSSTASEESTLKNESSANGSTMTQSKQSTDACKGKQSEFEIFFINNSFNIGFLMKWLFVY